MKKGKGKRGGGQEVLTQAVNLQESCDLCFTAEATRELDIERPIMGASDTVLARACEKCTAAYDAERKRRGLPEVSHPVIR